MATMRQTKKELLEEIEELEARVAELVVGEPIMLEVPPLYVRFVLSGRVVDDEGVHRGVVVPDTVMADPPHQTLRRVPHVVISEAEYRASPLRWAWG